MLSSTAKAAHQLVKVFEDPNMPGTVNIIKAAKEILDRGDVNKEETVGVYEERYVILLPPKDKDYTLLEDIEYEEVDD
jgi:hypothetical protein